MTRIVFSIAFLFCFSGCDSLQYDAPPEAKLAVPEGSLQRGRALVLTFSSPL